MIIAALASWTMNGLGNELSFQNAASKYYAAEGATQVAIRELRYTYNSPSPGFICPATSSPMEINDVWIQDWCALAQQGTSARAATVTACLVPSGSASLTGPCTVSSGRATRLAAATVVFYDSPSSGPYATATCTAANPAACGQSMSITGWTAY